MDLNGKSADKFVYKNETCRGVRYLTCLCRRGCSDHERSDHRRGCRGVRNGDRLVLRLVGRNYTEHSVSLQFPVV